MQRGRMEYRRCAAMHVHWMLQRKEHAFPGLVPGLMPAHADTCSDNVSFTGREELILRCATSAALPLKAHLAACTSLTVSHVSSAIRHLEHRRPDNCVLSSRVVLFYDLMLQIHSSLRVTGAARKGEYRVRGFGGVFTFPL